MHLALLLQGQEWVLLSSNLHTYGLDASGPCKQSPPSTFSLKSTCHGETCRRPYPASNIVTIRSNDGKDRAKEKPSQR